MLGAGSRSWEQAKAAMGWGWGYDCSREAMGRSVHPHRARGIGCWCSSCCFLGCICRGGGRLKVSAPATDSGQRCHKPSGCSPPPEGQQHPAWGWEGRRLAGAPCGEVWGRGGKRAVLTPYGQARGEFSTLGGSWWLPQHWAKQRGGHGVLGRCWDHVPPVPYAGSERCGAQSEVLPGRNGIGNRGWRCHQSWQVGFIDGHPDPKARRPGFQVSPSAVRGGPATNQGSLPPPAPQPLPFLPRSLGELKGPTGLKVCPCPTRRPFCNVSPCHKATGKLRPVPRHPLAPGACGAIEWIHGSCNKVGVAFFL